MKVGNYVFARVRGFPPWPAKILAIIDPRPSNLKAEVKFFGSDETATVRGKDILPYDSNKEDILKKNIRRKRFAEGIEELEKERSGGVAADVTPSDDTDPVNKVPSEPSPAPSVPKSAVKRRRVSDVADSPKPKKTPRRASASASSTIDSPDQTSRSGRVMKKKKFFDDENNESSIILESNEEDTSPTVNRKTAVFSKSGRLIWVKAKSGAIFPLIIDHDEPPAFKGDRLSWNFRYDKFIEKTKIQIEKGEKVAGAFASQVELFQDKDDDSEEAKLKKKQDRAQHWINGAERWRLQEHLICFLDDSIKKCLQKNNSNVEPVLEKLDELLVLPIDALMLKKWPQIVITVLQVSKYSGNNAVWKLSSKDEEKFKKTAAKIRTKAEMIINQFRTALGLSRTDDLWPKYRELANSFQEFTKGMTVDAIADLTCDPTADYYKDVVEAGEEIMKYKPPVTTVEIDVDEDSGNADTLNEEKS